MEVQDRATERIIQAMDTLRRRLVQVRQTTLTRRETEQELWEVEEGYRRIVETVDRMPAGLRARVEEEREGLVRRIRAEIFALKRLRTRLLTCPYCHRTRDDEGRWIPAEVADPADRPVPSLSHCICPDCLKRLHPEIFVG